MKKKPYPGVYLRFRLVVIQFENAQVAGSVMQQREHSAHPDMGLSYAWDHLILKEDYLYHLQAECVVSELNFISVSQQLEQVVGLGDGISSLNCRCGGGCDNHTSQLLRNRNKKYE